MSDDFVVIVDSREQKPYGFYGVETKTAGLDTGDYTVEGFEDVFAVERKSLDDLANTLGRGRKRFKREIERGETMQEFIVLIEASKEDIQKYRNQADCPEYYSMMHPNALLATTEKWPLKYDNLEFEWAGSRAEAKAKTLQYLKDWTNKYGDEKLDGLL